MDKSITDHYIFYKYIVASLVIVVMVSGELFFFFKNYEFNNKQYVALQIINTYMLFTGREIRIGKNCARSLDREHSLSQKGPT